MPFLLFFLLFFITSTLLLSLPFFLSFLLKLEIKPIDSYSRLVLVMIAELCLSLVKNEELAYYFAIELEGADFLFDQIRSSNTLMRSSFLVPAFANFLSHSTKKPDTTSTSSLSSTSTYSSVSRPATSPSPSSSSSITKYGYKLENFSNVSELLEPKHDKLLARLLKESATSSACVWTYNFKKLKHQEEVLSQKSIDD
jgi:hypothetical protein